MQFPSILVKARLLKRYKRFFVDAELNNGKIITAHCPNTGSMRGLTDPGSVIWVSKSDNPKRKLKYTWELIEDKLTKTLIGINTQSPNKIVYEALNNKLINKLKSYSEIKKEVKYGNNSRIDFLLNDINNNKCYLEVKNVHFSPKKGLAQFPDSVTTRGTKHLKELSNIAKSGTRAVMIYLVQRKDCSKFSIAYDIDPSYANYFDIAKKSGVEMLSYSCDINKKSISISKSIEISNIKGNKK